MDSENCGITMTIEKNSILEINNLPLPLKEQFELMKAVFYHGYDVPAHSISGMSTEEMQYMMDETLEQLETIYYNRPSIAYWIRSGLFEKNYSIPLALLCIALYEKYPLHPETKENNFKEIYNFLHELTMNRPATSISQNSSKILYLALSDIMNNSWSNMRVELLKFFGEAHQYNRPVNRRTYPGKKKAI